MIGQPAEMLASRHPTAEEMDAYERVLGDAMEGDATLFARQDYVEEAWRIVDPVLKKATPVYRIRAQRPGDRMKCSRSRPPRDGTTRRLRILRLPVSRRQREWLEWRT